VIDVRIEDGAQHRILADAAVEMVDERGDVVLGTDRGVFHAVTGQDIKIYIISILMGNRKAMPAGPADRRPAADVHRALKSARRGPQCSVMIKGTGPPMCPRRTRMSLNYQSLTPDFAVAPQLQSADM